MADIRVYDVYNRFLTRVRELQRSGISWGTNNYPSGSLLGWFGGSTGGDYTMPSYASIRGTDGELDALRCRSSLIGVAQGYFNVRNTQITIYRTRSGYYNNSKRLIYNVTAVAHLAPQYAADTGFPDITTVIAGNDVDQSDTYDFIESLRNNYLAFARGGATLLTRDVCHTRCHSRCHNSRGRR